MEPELFLEQIEKKEKTVYMQLISNPNCLRKIYETGVPWKSEFLLWINLNSVLEILAQNAKVKL